MNLLAESPLKIRLSDEELSVFSEYGRVMYPIAAKLDILQGDNNSYLGCLLPHILQLQKMLKSIESGPRPLVYCHDLVKLLSEKVTAMDRFGPVFENVDYQMATCFHPAYKLNWILMWKPSKTEEIREHMISRVADEIRKQDPDKQPAHQVTAERRKNEGGAGAIGKANTLRTLKDDSDDEEMEDLTAMLNSYHQDVNETQVPQKTYSEKAKELVSLWESNPAVNALSDDAFMNNGVLIELFLKTNTGVVSSAAVERFFSQGKNTLTCKRENMSAQNFEALMFMRGNAHLWAVPSAVKRRASALFRPHPLLTFLENEKC